LDIDAFFAAVEVLRNSALKGKPLIIGGKSGRGVVASCTYEARRFGIYPEMPMKLALRLCPDAIVIKGDYDTYAQYSQSITEIIQEQAPVFEKARVDEFYLDLTGMDQYVGCWKWSQELRTAIIKETGLSISCSLSVNKTVSKIGTGEAKPNGQQLIQVGLEKAFIAPLATRKLPGIGRKTFQRLALMGVRTIHTLSEIPPQLLRREFGKTGITLWQKANAIDNSPVIPYIEKKSISKEQIFQIDTIDVILLRGQLTQLVVQLAFDLRKQQKLTACIRVKIRYTDGNTYTLQKKISHTANDKTLLLYALQLFDKLYQRRQLIRLIGIQFSQLVHGYYQVNLFEDTQEEVNLLTAMDKIRDRFGHAAIFRASTL